MLFSLQKGIDPNTHKPIWLMLDEAYQIVEPVQQYLNFISSYRSPNTVESYAYDLKAWWLFLHEKHLDWKNVQLSNLEDFSYWLQFRRVANIDSSKPVIAHLSEKSINRSTTTVTLFYAYHVSSGNPDFKQFESFLIANFIGKKRWLSGISEEKSIGREFIKLKEPKVFPGCLSNEQIEKLVSSCSRLRDKFIILALNGTGARKGELFGLRHQDVGDYGNNTIRIIKRLNKNGALVKGQERIIPVSKELLELYNDYLIYEYPEVQSEYVFVNIWRGKVGDPMNLRVLNTMFERWSRKTKIDVYPHLLRHTYATRLLLAGYPAERVQYLLGHASIKTTLDIYFHIINGNALQGIIEQEED